MSLRKNFSINERAKFQIGLNAYNWLNHANNGVPYPNTNAPFFGETAFMQTPPTSPYGAFAAAATDVRMAQLTAKVTSLFAHQFRWINRHRPLRRNPGSHQSQHRHRQNHAGQYQRVAWSRGIHDRR